MLPKSYIYAKWTVYALATVLLSALQHMVLDHISIFGATPFLYPMLPALVGSYEGLQRGGKFALVMGVVCDALVAGPFEGFYTIIFTLIGLLAGLIGARLLSPGWLCGLTVSAMGLALTSLGRFAVYFFFGELRPILMGRLALLEIAITLPALVAALPVYRWIHKRCATDY